MTVQQFDPFLESTVVATTSYDVATTHLQIVAASSVVSTAEALCPGRQGCSGR